MASVVKVLESRKSQALMTSLPLTAPVGQVPGEGGVPTGLVPTLKRPWTGSYICITKSPATLAAAVQLAAAVGLPSCDSILARAVNAAKMSALFSIDFPVSIGFGGGMPSSP